MRGVKAKRIRREAKARFNAFMEANPRQFKQYLKLKDPTRERYTFKEVEGWAWIEGVKIKVNRHIVLLVETSFKYFCKQLKKEIQNGRRSDTLPI